ncbi:MAG: hypothetical protein WC284_12015 [Candidimonas sp.]
MKNKLDIVLLQKNTFHSIAVFHDAAKTEEISIIVNNDSIKKLNDLIDICNPRVYYDPSMWSKTESNILDGNIDDFISSFIKGPPYPHLLNYKRIELLYHFFDYDYMENVKYFHVTAYDCELMDINDKKTYLSFTEESHPHDVLFHSFLKTWVYHFLTN